MEPEQQALLDLSGKEYNVMWVDENQPLFIPNNPLHWKAHKLQILVGRLDKQAERNPAQFNSRNYIDAISELEKCHEQIRKGGDLNATDDEGGVAETRYEETASAVGARTPAGVGVGISADNPFAGSGRSPVSPVPVSAGVSELPGQAPGDK